MKYVAPLNGDMANPDRSYINADPANGIEGSIPSAASIEHPMREILNVITGAGLAPDGANLAQMSAAIAAMIAAAIETIPSVDPLPVGSVIPALSTAPLPGTLLLDASMPLRADYPALWTYIQTSGNLITEANWNEATSGSFSSGDGATNFRLPDARGVELRGFDGGRGFDVGRVFGTYQPDEIKAHTHSYSKYGAGGYLSGANSGATSGSMASTTQTGGLENRVKNITVNYCIKY